MENKDDFRTGFIAFIGRTNVGKSTLMNRLTGQKVAITSNKPQTTRNRILTVCTDDESQMIFLDTPGIHEVKNKLGEYMIRVAHGALDDVDVVCFVVEPSTFIGAGEREIIKELARCNKPLILVINKADTVKDRSDDEAGMIARASEKYMSEIHFDAVVPVSALRGEGTEELRKSIRSFLPYGPALYEEDTLTDQLTRDIVAEIIREKALRLLSDEVPHGIAVDIVKMRERIAKSGDPITDIDAEIVCERDSHKGIVIGKGGSMLKRIGSMARRDIEELIEMKCNLRVFVKVRKNWRDNDTWLRGFGYK